MSGGYMLASRTTEESFHTIPTNDDPLATNYLDKISFEMASFGVTDNRYHFGQQKCNSDSGVSTGEQEHLLMKEDTGRIGQQLPGAWFYEVGSGDDSSGSPVNEMDDIALATLRNSGVRNITESVEVPSSEHVAEIVGRQGCKIKALRAKTNTYIKTPVRGEEPVFVVTGRPEDVLEAKREIECAAEHFTQIRASRRHSQGTEQPSVVPTALGGLVGGGGMYASCGAPAPGHVTAYVRVPLRVVGLVVGPKGATIKRIQQDTHTYIITPSREREPIFEVTGLPQNVESARKEIEQHIYQRTGNMPITDPSQSITQYNSEMQNGMCMNNVPQTRSTYGALAQNVAHQMQSQMQSLRIERRPSAEPFTDFSNRQHQLTNDHQQNNMYHGGLLRAYGKQAYSAGGSPPASSPSLFSSSSTSSQGVFQPWATNTYNGAAFGIHGQGESDLFSRQSALSGASLWSSGFGSGLCGQTAPQQQARDEGLGDSPTNTIGGASDPYHTLMSSIWADIEQPTDVSAQPALLTA